MVTWTHHISLLPSLRHLVAGHTSLRELAQLSTLRCVSSLEVKMRREWGEEFHPGCFDALPPLRSIRISRMELGHQLSIADIFLAAVACSHGSSLERLDMAYLTDTGLAQLSSLAALRDLSAHYCNLATVMALQALCTLTGLRALDLHLFHGAVLTHDIFAPVIEALLGLTRLSLSNLPMTDEAAGLVSRLSRLQSLQLESWSHEIGHADGHMSEFARLSELRSASFGSEQLEGRGLAHLSAIGGLRRLSLRDCRSLSTSGLAQVAALRGLQQLSVSTSRSSLVPSGPLVPITSLQFLSGLESLQALELRCEVPTGVNLPQELAAALPHLLKLTLGNGCACDHVTEHITLLTSLRCVKLSIIDLWPNATDRGLECIARLPHLRKLCLEGMNEITDAGLGHLSAVHGLQCLKLNSCQRITADGVQLLRSRLPACIVRA